MDGADAAWYLFCSLLTAAFILIFFFGLYGVALVGVLTLCLFGNPAHWAPGEPARNGFFAWWYGYGAWDKAQT